MENIKSSYFMKFLFSFIVDETKLKIIKYNKSLQKILDININNYKNLSGKYTKMNQNGKGKNYNVCNDNLILESEFKNGMKKSEHIE